MRSRSLLLIGALAVALLAWPIVGAANDPQANFKAEPRLGEVPLFVSFTDTSTGDDQPFTFRWDFGDGQVSFDKNPTHTYQVPGKFRVLLTVTDSRGQTGTKDTDITVDGPKLVAALLPVSRSVVVGQPATAFLTIINAGLVTAPAVGVRFDPHSGPGGGQVPASLTFVETDPATNVVIGTPNALLDLAPGQRRSYLLVVTPTAPMPPTDVRFLIEGSNATRSAQQVSGLNTLLLSASSNATPDIVAIAITQSGDGILTLPSTSGSNAFAVATVNVGAGGLIRVSADTRTAVLPLAGTLVCQTGFNGQCTSGLESIVTTQIDSGATPTFAVFVTAGGVVPFDPELNRVFVRFTDAGGATRGATSVAVKTP